jgi:hypothetical protein
MLLLSAVQLVCAIRAHAALLKVLYVVEPRLDLVAYSSSNATVWCGKNHQIGRDRDAITGCRKKPLCGRRCRARIGRLAYTTSTKTGVRGNIQPYTFISIIRISSVRLRQLSWGRCLQLPGLRVAFRAMKIVKRHFYIVIVSLHSAKQWSFSPYVSRSAPASRSQ